MKGKRILLIDDDASLLQLAGVLFKNEGAEIATAHDGFEGLIKLFTFHPDLIILDVVMPEMDGFEICRRIRQISNVPLLMLTALNHEQEMLLGLNAGADDYLSKPFSKDILVARARAILRRANLVNPELSLYAYNDGHLSIDIERRQVLISGRKVNLTPLEFRLLVCLARNAGKVLTFEHILNNVWGTDYKGSVDYVHVYISRLRKKIKKKNKGTQYITTIHGIGYIFEKQELEYKF